MAKILWICRSSTQKYGSVQRVRSRRKSRNERWSNFTGCSLLDGTLSTACNGLRIWPIAIGDSISGSGSILNNSGIGSGL